MTISTRDIAGAQTAAQAAWAEDDALKTTEVGTAFEYMVAVADSAVEDFIKANATQAGGLQLSAGESLQLQRLMGDQSITVQTGTSTLKSIKDSISSAARNI
ncbi:hypothetical protein NMR92_003902 [Vibrio cholerae]|uniref:NT01VC2332 n=1 Tax=Vibrio cholerae non-O1/non-O139 TaxID=156539 RepID=Q45N91_VIBCL|nr:hypothetical protein [Vibrio cholerae]AAZ32234.1 NT01VC2332 [Vibrio cholerae non-O1/non-O139]EEO12819.1 hypothetical protein VCB_002812 [Vibrio cholerae TMA 21]EGQ9633957.1 hypothetical protein [Vibrio cholerae]EGR0031265.1 hypothetical protein [Vibrio cholerae]EGR2849207.1 hypothetical protein [Vibrio cholerae]